MFLCLFVASETQSNSWVATDFSTCLATDFHGFFGKQLEKNPGPVDMVGCPMILQGFIHPRW